MKAEDTFDLLVDFCEYIKQEPYLGSDSVDIVRKYIKERYVNIPKEDKMFFLFKILFTLIQKLFNKKKQKKWHDSGVSGTAAQNDNVVP
nr:MAG: hypothetical protein [Microvirus sp.]